MADTNARKSLHNFCKFGIRTYGPDYPMTWGKEELAKELEVNAARGFPCMMGSIDCVQWEWKNGPIAWHGMFKDRNRKII